MKKLIIIILILILMLILSCLWVDIMIDVITNCNSMEYPSCETNY